MADMLVKLFDLPEVKPLIDSLRAEGIDVRRSIAPEKHVVVNWVAETFEKQWASETDVSYRSLPATCWIATRAGRCIGFACYDTTARGFFGPTGVDAAYRGKGIGKALLLVCLHDMRAHGYAYAIIGDPGPVEFYAKTVGAVTIPDTWPGIYRGMLLEDGSQPY